MTVTREQVNRFITTQLRDDEIHDLIEQHVDHESLGTGIARARIRGTGVTVATLIDHLEAVDGDVNRTANSYDLALDHVLAAIYFYWRYQSVIDAEITVRRSAFID